MNDLPAQTTAEKLRILVLTSSTGGGHDARAQAFAEWCYQLYPGHVDVRIEQMLEKSSVINRGGVGLYNWIQKNIPVLHTAFYSFIELYGRVNWRSVALGRGYYKKVLRDYRPHLVFSVHDCLNRGYFQLARKILGRERVRCATYCGEFSGGWGYSRNWVEPSADLYISRTCTANRYAIEKLGMAGQRTLVRGHLMRPSAHLEHIDAAQRALSRKRRYGLRPDTFTVFLATGGNGANNHFDLLPALVNYRDRCQAIIICGSNRDVYNKLMRWRAANPDFRCHIEGYSESVHLLMQASDVIVTRGGTTTCAQALHFSCPIVFNGFGGIMPQEKLTLKYFCNTAGSSIVRSSGDFAALIGRWMTDPVAYRDYRESFIKARYEEDPTRVIDELVTLARASAPLMPPPVRRPFPPANGNCAPRKKEEPVAPALG
ncbi:MAG: glycosyltransferase [Opitutaceae bacterium]|jgi:processive 1,2-diacylglycerol beta-glucosyltransferase|nr:glycosyltransferase [Opitutaceae bacterium]